MMRLAALGLVIGVLLVACQQETIAPEREAASDSHTQTFTLPAGATVGLEIRGSAGSITVQVGAAAGTVELTYTLTAYATSEDDARDELRQMAVGIHQDGAQITIDAVQRRREDDTRTNQVDLTLTVPETVGRLDIRHESGDVRITGVRLAEMLEIDHGVGNVTLQDVTAAAGLDVVCDAGNVSFDGALGETGDYRLEVNAGGLSVTLPADTDADLDAATTLGGITVRGFEVQDSGDGTPGITRRALTGELGAGGPLLRLRVATGDIRLAAR